jgi:hypothetical protein
MNAQAAAAIPANAETTRRRAERMMILPVVVLGAE